MVGGRKMLEVALVLTHNRSDVIERIAYCNNEVRVREHVGQIGYPRKVVVIFGNNPLGVATEQ